VEFLRQGVSPDEYVPPEFEAPKPEVEASAWNRVIPIARLLWGRRAFLTRFVVMGVILSLAVASIVPKRYESTTRLMPPDQRGSGGMALLSTLATAASGGGGALGGIGGIGADILGLQTSGALFVAILRSRTVQDRLVDRLDLRKLYGVKRFEDARKILAERTTLKDDRKSGVISVTVTDRDARRSAEMAKAYVQELDRLLVQVSTSDARREREFLEGRLKEVKQDLDSASKELSEFSSKNATLDIKEQGRAMVEGAARLQGELIAAQSQLSGLEQIYTRNNVRVRSARARVDELQRQLDRLGGSQMNPTQDSATLGYPSIRQLPLLAVRFTDLYRRTKIQEVIFEILTRQYELAKVQEAKDIPGVRVLDAANVPERHVFPHKSLFLIFGFLLSFVLASSWVLGREFWQQIDSGNPGKAFLQEIFTGLQARNPWRHRQNFRLYSAAVTLVARFRRADSAVAAERDVLPSGSKTNSPKN
jgi:uncharacterized protein involved in exopolysaccharide biosynthesis